MNRSRIPVASRHRRVRSADAPPQLYRFLRRELAAGRMILFTGAGFSSMARDAAGRGRVPTGEQLRRELWDLCFSGEQRDASTLQDLYAHAQVTRPRQLRELLDQRLRVDPRALPQFYEPWLALPWRRVYTLNVDNLATAAMTRFALPRRIRALSALRDGVEDTMLRIDGHQLDVIHLNGIVDDGPERVTFSTVQYAGRLARRCAFYSQLVRDFAEYPVLFVGTKLDEMPLWQHLEVAGLREQISQTPPGLLVTQHVTRARANLLAALNIHWLAMDVRTFSTNVLAPLRDQTLEPGLRALERTRVTHRAAKESAAAQQS
ncbi:MAG: hypothetical protein JWM53_3160 [bacterium]|nr:hypothetical protein [bacterium]